MKVTPKTPTPYPSKTNPPPKKSPPDLPPKRKQQQPGSARRRPVRTPKKAGPPTPLLRWKYHHHHKEEEEEERGGNAGNEEVVEGRRRTARRAGGVSARKLAAVLWRMHGGGDAVVEEERMRRRESGEVRKDGKEEGYKPELGHGGDRLSYHHAGRGCGTEAKDPRSPCSVNGPINGYLCERQSPFHASNYAMEGATKWDPVSKVSNEDSGDPNSLDQKLNDASLISALETELEQARTRIEELESERRSSKKKVEHFLKKLSEERAVWRSREHEKVRAIIDDVKADLTRERKNRQRLEIVNSKLVNELTEMKLSAKRYMQDYEKERKARELIEEVCDELAKEIGEDKAEVDSLKKECMKIREEVEDERKMLQMAEVWREERVQMKLIDAKVALDQKYSQMKWIVEEFESFLRSKGVSLNADEVREVEMLKRAAASINIQDIKEFNYEPSNSDDIFAVVEEMAMAEGAEEREREIEACVEYSPASHASRVLHRLSNVYENGDVDDDVSGWETVSQAEDQGSSYSAEGSTISVNKMCRDSNASGSCTEWEDQQMEDISEVCSVSSKKVKKVKSISRLWRSSNGDNYKIISVDAMNGRLSNGRVSNGGIMSPVKGGISPSDMVGWSSPDSGNPHINRGMKGCIEWPRNGQKNSLKNKLLEARMESQKIQLRQVLKQKI